MIKTKYAVEIDGDVFSMSSENAAIKAAEANETGGIVIAPDGTRKVVTHKTQSIVYRQAIGNFDDGGLT